MIIADRVRWRREDKTRWIGSRQGSSAAFLAAVDRWNELDHVAALRGENEEWFDAPEQDMLDPIFGAHTTTGVRPRATEAAMAASDRLVELVLIASVPVREAAEALQRTTRELSWTRFGDPPRSCGGASSALVTSEAAQHESRERFIQAVRRDLAVDV